MVSDHCRVESCHPSWVSQQRRYGLNPKRLWELDYTVYSKLIAPAYNVGRQLASAVPLLQEKGALSSSLSITLALFTSIFSAFEFVERAGAWNHTFLICSVPTPHFSWYGIKGSDTLHALGPPHHWRPCPCKIKGCSYPGEASHQSVADKAPLRPTGT